MFLGFFSLRYFICWKEQLFLLSEVISSDRAACVAVPAWCWCPQRNCCESFEARFSSSRLYAATGFDSHWLRLCVMYIQQNNLGLDRTFPSPNCVELQTVNFWKNQVLLSGCHLCSSSSAGVHQLLANSLVHHEDFGWALPEWEGDCTVPVAALPSPSMGGDRWTGPLYYTLCTGLNTSGVCAASASAAQLLAACKSGAALPACVPWAKLSCSSFFFFPCFPSSFHRPRIRLADLVPFSAFLAEMWCLQIKCMMNTMKICSLCQI